MGKEMAEQHPRINGHEFEQTQGDSEGQEILMCCSPQSSNELDTTEQVKNKTATTPASRQIGLRRTLFFTPKLLDPVTGNMEDLKKCL